MSQLNHVLAKRQPAHLQAVCIRRCDGYGGRRRPRVITPSTMVDDEPTTFWFDGKPYEPATST